MKQAASPALVAGALVILAACTTPPPPIVDHRDEAIQQIRAVEEAAIRAFVERNADRAAAFYAPDATMMMTNMPLLKGSDAIKSVLKEQMADPNFSTRFTTAKVEATKSGELGYTRGAYIFTMTDPKSKKALRETGKYLTVYAKQTDGSWKIIEDITNSDAPAVPVAEEKATKK